MHSSRLTAASWQAGAALCSQQKGLAEATYLCQHAEGPGVMPVVADVKHCLWPRQVEALQLAVQPCTWRPEIRNAC